VKSLNNRSQTLVVPVKSWLAMMGTFLLLICAATLLVLSERGHPAVLQMERSVQDAMTPVLNFLAQPANALSNIATRFEELVHLHEQNKTLRDENARLLHWQTVALQLRNENETLRSLLSVDLPPEYNFITARVVSGQASMFSHFLLLDAGRQDGLFENQAVIATEGLVGRVILAGKSSAQVLLITDINSRIPVIIEETGEKAILAGNNSMHPTLKFMDPQSGVKPGQRIVTASDGEVFPAGFAVGEIKEVPSEGRVTVHPYVDVSRLSFVQAVDVSDK
jgi:rod shape-determining protein MreC